MFVKVKKVWMGHVSVRDYDVERCIKDKEDLTICLYDQMKTYPYRSLKTYLLNTSNMTMKSKYGGKDYKLIDFPWESTSY